MILYAIELRPTAKSRAPFSWVGLTHKGARILVKRQRNRALFTRDEARAIVRDLAEEVERGRVRSLGEVVVVEVDEHEPQPMDKSRRNPERL